MKSWLTQQATQYTQYCSRKCLNNNFIAKGVKKNKSIEKWSHVISNKTYRYACCLVLCRHTILGLLSMLLMIIFIYFL